MPSNRPALASAASRTTGAPRRSPGRVLAPALALAALASGCRMPTRGGALPESPTWYRRPGWMLEVDQSRALTAPSEVVGEDHERGQPTLDLAHRRLFVGSSDRGLYALRAEDLTTIWRFQTAGFVQCEPLYDEAEDAVYFGSNDGALYKVRAADGSLLWRFATNAEVARRPVLDGGVVYFTNANDTVVAVEAASGKLRWSYHRTPAYGMEIAGHAGVTVQRGRVYSAFSDGRIEALDAATGKESWSYDLAAEAESAGGEEPIRYLDSDATPVFARTEAGSVVFVAGYEGGVFALDADTGGRVWGREDVKGATDLTLWSEPAHTPREGGPALPARRLLLASSGTTGLWGLSLDDGRPLWRRALPEGGISRPVAWSGALLLSTTRYGLFLVSPVDGSVIDGLDTGTGFAMTPTAHGQRAFVMSNQGQLYSLLVDPPGQRGAGVRANPPPGPLPGRPAVRPGKGRFRAAQGAGKSTTWASLPTRSRTSRESARPGASRPGMNAEAAPKNAGSPCGVSLPRGQAALTWPSTAIATETQPSRPGWLPQRAEARFFRAASAFMPGRLAPRRPDASATPARDGDVTMGRAPRTGGNRRRRPAHDDRTRTVSHTDPTPGRCQPRTARCDRPGSPVPATGRSDNRSRGR